VQFGGGGGHGIGSQNVCPLYVHGCGQSFRTLVVPKTIPNFTLKFNFRCLYLGTEHLTFKRENNFL
jgi:hypothetical protein